MNIGIDEGKKIKKQAGEVHGAEWNE